MAGRSTTRYPAELRDWAAMVRVAELLGIGAAGTVRTWGRQAAVDAGDRRGVTSEEIAKVKQLKRLKRVNRGQSPQATGSIVEPWSPQTHGVASPAWIDKGVHVAWWWQPHLLRWPLR